MQRLFLRSLACGAVLTAGLSAPAFAFDLNSALDSLNKAVDTVKNVGSSTGVSSGTTGDTPSSSTPKFKMVQPSPVSPMADARISDQYHSYKELDEYTVLLSRPAMNSDGSIRVASSKTLRGQVFRDQYDHPDSQSTLQVWESFKQQLSNDGYKLEFVCDKPCAGNSNVWYTTTSLIIYDKTDRYLVAHKDNNWVTVTIGQIDSHPRSSVNVVVAAQ